MRSPAEAATREKQLAADEGRGTQIEMKQLSAFICGQKSFVNRLL